MGLGKTISFPVCMYGVRPYFLAKASLSYLFAYSSRILGSRAWQFFRATGKIGGVNVVVKRIVGHGNSHRRGLPEFITAPWDRGRLARRCPSRRRCITLLYRLVRGFSIIIRHIATGFAGGRLFTGNANREVITVPFLRIRNPELRSTGIMPVNTHGQDTHATIILIIHCGAAAGRVLSVAGL